MISDTPPQLEAYLALKLDSSAFSTPTVLLTDG
jgi:hypothetical protein